MSAPAELDRRSRADCPDTTNPVRRLDPRVARSRETILEAAREIIWERGPAAFTVEAIVERTSVALTTIYRQWPTRKELLAAAIASLAELGPLPDTGSLHGDLLAFFTAGAKRIRHNAQWKHNLTTLPGLIEAARHDPDILAMSELTMRRLLAELRLMLARGAARGEIETGRDTEVMSDLLLGAIVIRHSYRRTDATDAYVAELVDIITRAFRREGLASTPASAR